LILSSNIHGFKEFLDILYDKYNVTEYIETDPIFYPHTLKGNREFIAITASCFAYGNVKAIKKFLLSFFETCGTDPENLKNNPENLYYRFQNKDDVLSFINIMKELYNKYGSIENVFKNISDDLDEAVIGFHKLVMELADKHGAGKGFRFLFPNPVTSGAKRLRMFLRWMIREDDIDFGIWKGYSPSVLDMPIDTHILRFSKNAGIVSTESATRKNMETVTSMFKELNPDDPAKYDFALTRLGIVEKCIYIENNICETCILRDKCPFLVYSNF